MEDQEQYFENIENYLSGKLNEEEFAEFEQMISSNSEFAKEVELHKSLQDSLGDSDLQDFRSKVQTIIEEGKNSKVISLSFYWKVAAGVLLIAVASFLIAQFLNEEDFSNREIALQYFEPYDNLITERGELNELISKGMFAYDKKNYKDAIRMLSNEKLKDNELVSFYLGLSYLASENGEAAENEFIKASQGNKSLRQAINWYLSLSYLLQGNDTKGKELLKEITESNSTYKKQAERLLEALH